jgi:hypothetical protein
MLVRTAATPIKNDPSIIMIADSFLRDMFAICSHVGKGDSAMTVKIEPVPESVRLRVNGDIETTLAVPYEDDDRFLIGLSDGTLLQGAYDDQLECKWEVARDGAGFVRLEGRSIIVDWRMEWVTVSAYDPNVIEPPLPPRLPLFPDLDRWAA